MRRLNPVAHVAVVLASVLCLSPVTGDPASAQGATGSIQGTVTCHTVRDCTGAVVYVPKLADRTYPPGPERVVDQVNLTFVPHVLTVVTGTRVAFPNSDAVRHNIFSASQTKRFNLGTYPKGTVKYVVFDQPGIVELLCNVHAEMSAYIVVADTPFAAMVQPDGSYTLRDVPAGTYPVAAWHEQLKEERQELTVKPGQVATLRFDLRPR
jgi:plastocyanin